MPAHLRYPVRRTVLAREHHGNAYRQPAEQLASVLTTACPPPSIPGDLGTKSLDSYDTGFMLFTWLPILVAALATILLRSLPTGMGEPLHACQTGMAVTAALPCTSANRMLARQRGWYRSYGRSREGNWAQLQLRTASGLAFISLLWL